MNRTLLLDVSAAKREVSTKSASQIERETAINWAARAIACQELYQQTKNVRWLMQATEYRHEALEHAAVSDLPTLVEDIRLAIGEIRP